MASYVSDEAHDQIEATQSAGGATEYLLRSVLCLHDPALLASPKHPQSAIALSRANTGAALNVLDLRTISFSEVLGLLRILHPTLNVEADVRMVMNLRNAAAHMALTDRMLLKEAITRLVVIVTKVHGLVNQDEAEYWGADLSSVVESMLNEHATAITRTLEAKFARARQFLAELTGGLNPGDVEAVLTARETRSVLLDGDDQDERECPVCNRWGWLGVSTEKGEPFQYSNSDDFSWRVEIDRWATMFRCPVCGLLLEMEELDIAGLPIELSSRYEEITNPYADIEPYDEDYVRGR